MLLRACAAAAACLPAWLPACLLADPSATRYAFASHTAPLPPSGAADDSSMTLEEWEARRKAGGTRDGPGSGTALDPPASTADVSDASLQPQQQQLLSDEELARQLQRQLDLEAAQEWGRPAERYQVGGQGGSTTHFWEVLLRDGRPAQAARGGGCSGSMP